MATDTLEKSLDDKAWVKMEYHRKARKKENGKIELDVNRLL